MEKVILFGASGQQGAAIAQHLISRGYSLVALVRSQKNVGLLRQQDIEAILTDFSTASFTGIVKDADKVVSQIPAVITPREMIALAENALKAIAQAGSPNTVFNITRIVPNECIEKERPGARLTMKNLAKQLLPNAIILSSKLHLENFSQAYRQAIGQGGVIPQAIPNNTPVAYLSFTVLASFILVALNKPLI